jgi:hypothetical protein
MKRMTVAELTELLYLKLASLVLLVLGDRVITVFTFLAGE